MELESLRELVREVSEFVAIIKYDDDYIRYDLSINSNNNLGWISRHNPGGIDDGAEYDVWTINLDDLSHGNYSYAPPERKEEAERVVEFIRNSPSYANFMRLTQAA